MVDPGTYTLTAESGSFVPVTKTISVSPSELNSVDMEFVGLVSQKSVVIVSSTLEPSIDRRNDEVYKKTLFGRESQLPETLDADGRGTLRERVQVGRLLQEALSGTT